MNMPPLAILLPFAISPISWDREVTGASQLAGGVALLTLLAAAGAAIVALFSARGRRAFRMACAIGAGLLAIVALRSIFHLDVVTLGLGNTYVHCSILPVETFAFRRNSFSGHVSGVD